MNVSRSQKMHLKNAGSICKQKEDDGQDPYWDRGDGWGFKGRNI